MCRMLRGSGMRGIIIDLMLVVAILTLSLVFIKRYSQLLDPNPSYEAAISGGVARYENRAGGEGSKSSGKFIEARIKEMGDQRSKRCLAKSYNIKESVSIVIDFNDYQFYNAKATIGSVINAGLDYVTEILVIDDGSTLQYIIDESVDFFKSVPKTKLFRSSTQLGQIKSRAMGLTQAKADIVVYLDINVICTQGWLEPLIDLVTIEPSVVAVPHYDLIHDPVALSYRPTPSNLVAQWTWNLAIKMKRRKDINESQTEGVVDSPALRGNAYAARKSVLQSLAGLDEFYEDGGGEYLDLSMKTWLCGGSIKKVLCSRVGVINLHSPVLTRARRNVRRITESWFGQHRETIARLAGITNLLANLTTPDKDLFDRSKCKDLAWYLKEVKRDIRAPTPAAIYYGMLRLNTGRCAKVGSDKRLDLEFCDEHSDLEPFELTWKNQLRATNGECLGTSGSAYIILEPCRDGDSKQEFKYNDRRELLNTWSQFCAVHVTDPDKAVKEGRQIAMVQKCNLGASQNDQFKQWFFIDI